MLKGGINDATIFTVRVLVTVPRSALASSLPLWDGLLIVEVLAFLPLSILSELIFNYKRIYL